MALNRYAVAVLKDGLGDRAAAQEVVTLLNTHASGTLSSRTKRIIREAMGSRADGNVVITAFQASTALPATTVAELGHALGSRRGAALIAAELIA